ncbi:MAG: hypothetical protein ACKOC8_02555 [Pirellulales bacterium]
MIHRGIACAVAILLVASATCFAGGGGAKATIPVRMKNVGRQSVAVNAQSGLPSDAALLKGRRNLAPNGVSQFMVRRGAFKAMAANPLAPSTVRKTQAFDTRSFKVFYLYALQDGTTATVVGAPGGVKF